MLNDDVDNWTQSAGVTGKKIGRVSITGSLETNQSASSRFNVRDSYERDEQPVLILDDYDY